MATSPLFGWEEPDDVDLVKDGAAAIRTLGNAIDTSMGDLLGGTTGQVLAKASNTNMDFTWVAQDDSNAIQNAIVDAKGDLIAASAADTPARLAVGNNGETLVADSSATTGLRYQGNFAAGKNALINGAMQIWQRGTSIAIPASNVFYTTDRWEIASSSGANYTVSRQATNDTTNLPFIQYCARVQRDSGQTGLNPTYFIQGIESVNAIPYAGKTVTMSFYARRGANFSASSNTLTFLLAEGTGTDQNPAGAYDSQNSVINTPVTLTTTWQRFTATGTVASTTKELKAFFTYTPTGTAGAADFYEVTGVQVEAGSVATAFQTATGTLAGELACAQRYYVRFANGGAYSAYGYGNASSTTVAYPLIALPVAMRIAPSTLEYSNLQLGDTVNAGSNLTALTVQFANPQQAVLEATVVSGLTQYRNYQIRNANSTAGYLGFSAEL